MVLYFPIFETQFCTRATADQVVSMYTIKRKKKKGRIETNNEQIKSNQQQTQSTDVNIQS